VVRRTGSIQDGTNYNEDKEPLVLDDEKGAPYELPETKMQRTQGHVLIFLHSFFFSSSSSRNDVVYGEALHTPS
jgi:hypothetical protein